MCSYPAASAKRPTAPLHILCDPNPELLQRDLLSRVVAGALVVSLTPEANAALPTGQPWPVADVTAERLQAGCPCCVGQVVFRTRLVQWLRKSRPTQVLLLTTLLQQLQQQHNLLIKQCLTCSMVTMA